MFQRLLRLEWAPGADPLSSPRAAGPRGPVGPLAALVVVFAALFSLTIIGVVLEREVSGVRREVTQLTDPGTLRVHEIQMLLALEAAGVRGHLLTGEAAYLTSYRSARAARMVTVQELNALVRVAAPELRDLAAQLSAQLAPADAVLDSLDAALLSAPEFLRRLSLQQQRFQAVTQTTHRLGDAFSRMSAARVARAQRVHRIALLFGLPIMTLAVLAVILVEELGASYRALAGREHVARAHAESEHARAEQRREEIERIADSRARLVRGFTHDVKNPLHATLGVFTLMDEGILAPGEGIPRARRSLSAALGLIDDLLRVARDEAGDIVVVRGAVDLCAVARECAADWRAAAESKGLRLAVELPDESPPLESDAGRVGQIVGNLLSNAVNYTGAGSVTIRVATRDEPTGAKRWAVVEVHDTGPGMSAEQQAQLFQDYRRLGTSAGTKGHGLGLAISQRIATALGGRITVESEVGVGSTFTLVLPRLATVMEADVTRPAAPPAEALVAPG